MFRCLLLFSSLIILAWSGLATADAYGQVETENARVELISEQDQIVPGETFWIGIRMEIRDGWYVYYRNPGDSGLPMTVNWTHGTQIEISDIHWPYPEWINVSGGLTSYGYRDSTLYMMQAVAPENLEPGDRLTLSAETDWLICEDICIPEYADLELTLNVAEKVAFNEETLPIFSEYRERLPADLSYWQVFAEAAGDTIQLRLSTEAFELPDYSNLKFFAYQESVIENGADQPVKVDGDQIIMSLQRSSYATESQDSLGGLLYSDKGWDESGRIKAMNIDVELGKEPASNENQQQFSGSYLLILGFALLGGVILNLMPCVFPILSIKVMNFLEMSGEGKSTARFHGLMFGAGVLISFLILAGLLLLLRAGGEQLGWGFQLQSPMFIAFMTFLMFGLGLSLMGVFEVGNSLVSAAGKAETGGGVKGSFFSGVLATVLATPCTAPFMGTALGAAVTMPSVMAMLVFASLGLGMALPYLILSFFPALLKRMPRPGPWMETFKQLMAFPLFGTAIWLIWVFGQQTGTGGIIYLLAGLLLFSMAIWILHRWKRVQITFKTRVISRAFVVLLMAGGFLISAAAIPDRDQNAPSSPLTDSYGVEWEPFDSETVTQYSAAGENVFIDFTAAWCITCKANERVVFSSEDVRSRFRELDFKMIKADWTNRNPEITRALESYGRNGVPLYVIYHDGSPDPVILPELLTPGIVLDALEDIPANDKNVAVSEAQTL